MTDTYTLQLLREAQAKLRPLVESKNPGTQQHEFYSVILETMYALDMACRENTAMRRSFDNLTDRVKILEKIKRMENDQGIS